VARHIFQACYTQSNITQASYSPEYIRNFFELRVSQKIFQRIFQLLR
jgi:hypothetical protein